MKYFSYLTPVDTEITIAKLDKVAKKLSDKIKAFAKFFVILTGWLVFNVIVALFIDRTRSISLDTYRAFSEGLHSLAAQDIFFILTLIFDNKICYVITLAMTLALSVAFFVRLLYFTSGRVSSRGADKLSNRSKTKNAYGGGYVVSYKHQVAFLS